MSVYKKGSILLVMFTLLCLNTNKLYADNKNYSTDILFEMAQAMGIDKTIESWTDGIHWKALTYKGKPVTVIVSDGIISHIGYSIITPSSGIREMNHYVANFLERYTLLRDIPIHKEKSFDKQVQEDRIIFQKGSFNFVTSLTNDTAYDVSISNRDDKYYKLEWSKKGVVYCSMAFPISYDLLNGSSMIENEQRIMRMVLSTKVNEAQTVLVEKEHLLRTWQNNYYIKEGNSYYIDKLSSRQYYESTDTHFCHLLYDIKHPVETVANLLTSIELSNEYMIEIHQKKYGFKEDVYSIPLRQWISYCLKQGCTPYFGVIKYDGNTIVCESVMKNEKAGYNHLMKLTMDINTLTTRKGMITARLNCFIPLSKIDDLFADIRN